MVCQGEEQLPRAILSLELCHRIGDLSLTKPIIPSGAPPRADYEALLDAAGFDEDAADVAMYDTRKAQLSETGTLPAKVSMHMLRGDTRLRAIRKWRGIKQTTLSAIADVGQGYLSDLERGGKGGTDETFRRLAAVSSVPVEWLR